MNFPVTGRSRWPTLFDRQLLTEERMKTLLLSALVGLAIRLALPTFAQQQDTVAPEIREQIEAVLMKFDEAYNKHDAAAIADLFIPDAVDVFRWRTEGGAAVGKQAIKKRYESETSESSATNMNHKLIQAYAIGSDICAFADRSAMMWKDRCLVIFVRMPLPERSVWPMPPIDCKY
jgi:uncharacterized protein (TIGR02246 family)